MFKDLVEYLVQQLVIKAEAVRITEEFSDGVYRYSADVDDRDRGKVIGKEGQTIRSLRYFLSTIAPDGATVEFDLVQQ